MISVISVWFKSLNKTSKIFTIVLALLLIVLGVQSARLARSEYLRLKSIKSEYKAAKEVIKEAEETELKIVKKSVDYSKKSIESNKEINKKLQSDEKIINDTDISDDELRSYITKHETK